MFRLERSLRLYTRTHRVVLVRIRYVQFSKGRVAMRSSYLYPAKSQWPFSHQLKTEKFSTSTSMPESTKPTISKIICGHRTLGAYFPRPRCPYFLFPLDARSSCTTLRTFMKSRSQSESDFCGLWPRTTRIWDISHQSGCWSRWIPQSFHWCTGIKHTVYVTSPVFNMAWGIGVDVAFSVHRVTAGQTSRTRSSNIPHNVQDFSGSNSLNRWKPPVTKRPIKSQKECKKFSISYWQKGRFQEHCPQAVRHWRLW